MSISSTTSEVGNKSYMLTNVLEEFDVFHKNEAQELDGQFLRLAKICFYLQSSMSISWKDDMLETSKLSGNSLYSSDLKNNSSCVESCSMLDKTRTLHNFCEADLKEKTKNMAEYLKKLLLNRCFSSNVSDESESLLANYQYRKLEDEEEIPQPSKSKLMGVGEECSFNETSTSLWGSHTYNEAPNSDAASTCSFISYEKSSDSKLSYSANANESAQLGCLIAYSDDYQCLNELLSDDNFLTISEVEETMAKRSPSNLTKNTMDDRSQSSSATTPESSYSSSNSTRFTSVSLTDEGTSGDKDSASLSSTTESDSSVSIREDSISSEDLSVSLSDSSINYDHSGLITDGSETDDSYFVSSAKSTTDEDRSSSLSTESMTDNDRSLSNSDESYTDDESSVSCLGYSPEDESASSSENESSSDYSLLSYSGESETDYGNTLTVPYDILINSDNSFNSVI